MYRVLLDECFSEEVLRCHNIRKRLISALKIAGKRLGFKVVKGQEIDAEYDLIETAVNSKAILRVRVLRVL